MNPRGGTVRAIAAILLIGMMLSAGLAGVVSVLASDRQDGVQAAGQNHDSASTDPIVDADASNEDGGRFSVAAAGLIGIGITALAAFTLFARVKPRAAADES